jgi:2,4-dienoyl-CoA reductase-like NADH-dependent reductase (Old Yellow Enzyme family)
MPHLFEPLRLRDARLRNRVAMSPMCTYSAEDGRANDWHLVHLGARAAGGVGLVVVEATAVEARGRISPFDLGLWRDDQVDGLRRVADFVRSQGAASAVQLAHAGRKASTHRPWAPASGAVADEDGGWPVVGATAEPFSPKLRTPTALDEGGIADLVTAFADAAARADAASFDAVEIHAAHGYLIHQFLSPLVNSRDDRYGGDFAGRSRLLREVVRAVRGALPEAKPLLLRISATDWVEGGWTPDDSVRLAGELAGLGVDLVDCSSGGAIAGVQIPAQPGYQVPFAERVRREAGVASGAVGRITTAAQADAIVREGRADVVLLGKALLDDPQWAVHAAQELNGAPERRAAGTDDVKPPWPVPYGWVFG